MTAVRSNDFCALVTLDVKMLSTRKLERKRSYLLKAVPSYLNLLYDTVLKGTAGVPQVSVLCSLLWNIMYYDLLRLIVLDERPSSLMTW